MGSQHGLSDEQLMAVVAEGPVDLALFDERQSVALRYAEAMTSADVDDELFAEVQAHFDEDAIVELTGVIAWENSSARFNRALRVPSQNLWDGPTQR